MTRSTRIKPPHKVQPRKSYGIQLMFVFILLAFLFSVPWPSPGHVYPDYLFVTINIIYTSLGWSCGHTVYCWVSFHNYPNTLDTPPWLHDQPGYTVPKNIKQKQKWTSCANIYKLACTASSICPIKKTFILWARRTTDGFTKGMGSLLPLPWWPQ